MRTVVCLLYLVYTSTYLTVANGNACGAQRETAETLIQDINVKLNRLTSTLANLGESCTETPYSGEPLPAEIQEVSCSNTGLQSCTRGPCRVLCPPGCSNGGEVWGSDYYTSDSSICRAAIHAGVISDSDGGEVIVALGQGVNRYEGTTRNGVTTKRYDRYPNTMYFIQGIVTNPADKLKVPLQTAECEDPAMQVCVQHRGPCRIRCPSGCASASRTVWGTTFYTGDSSLCKAAIHDGRITDSDGGFVNLAFRPGDESYVGSIKNGITTVEYGPWSLTFYFFDGIISDERSRYPTLPNATPPPTTPPPTTPEPEATAINCNTEGRACTNSSFCTMSCPEGCATTSKTVWGTYNSFTDDSGICRAAIHQRVITNSGGIVKVYRSDGLSSYRGATRNGVTTQSYGQWSGTMSFVLSR